MSLIHTRLSSLIKLFSWASQQLTSPLWDSVSPSRQLKWGHSHCTQKVCRRGQHSFSSSCTLSHWNDAKEGHQEGTALDKRKEERCFSFWLWKILCYIIFMRNGVTVLGDSEVNIRIKTAKCHVWNIPDVPGSMVTLFWILLQTLTVEITIPILPKCQSRDFLIFLHPGSMSASAGSSTVERRQQLGRCPFEACHSLALGLLPHVGQLNSILVSEQKKSNISQSEGYSSLPQSCTEFRVRVASGACAY